MCDTGVEWRIRCDTDTSFYCERPYINKELTSDLEPTENIEAEGVLGFSRTNELNPVVPSHPGACQFVPPLQTPATSPNGTIKAQRVTLGAHPAILGE